MRLTGILFISLFSLTIQAQDNIFNIIFRHDFEGNTLGAYRYNEWKHDWNSPAYVNNLEHTYIINTGEGNKAMKWVYPVGSVGPSEGGGQFEAPFHRGVDEVYFSYNIKFRPGFEWVLGGKIPGLTGGPHSYYTGVSKPGWNDGFSCGLMWGHDYDHVDADGAIYFYTYHQDMPGVYGESFRWGTFKFETDPGRWYNITIRLVMNTLRSDGSGGNYDGIMEGFVDGKLVVSKTGLRFRNLSSIHIDKMKIYSHFGGSGPEYGALRDEWVLLDDVCLFTYNNTVDVPRGNVASKPGRILQLPNLKSSVLPGIKDDQAPTTPASVRITGQNLKDLALEWNTSNDNVGVSGYKVFMNDREIGQTSKTTYQLKGMVPAKTYAFSVAAYDAAGNQSTKSGMLKYITPGPDTIAPSIPQGLADTEKTDSEVHLRWDPSTDNTGVMGYRIYVDGGERGTSAGPAYIVKHLNPSTRYKVSVAAYDAASNQSKPSKPVSVKTEPADTEAPTVPVGITVLETTNHNATVSWHPSKDNRSVEGYAIFINGMFKGTTPDTTYIIKGLQEGVKYFVSVTAFDAHSNKSAASEQVEVNTGNPTMK